MTYRSIGVKTTVTTLNQFCCPSRNYQGHMWGLSQCSTVVRNTVVRAVQKCIGKPRFWTPVAQ